ncbi:hypothetical protein ACFKHW_40135 (plasmid) [Bradyrhizobium lupini]|uniref:hypothetical protein n=1 Tax=Rhizobium lupini TaxID=136996 RepID=UPI00366F5E22
MAAYNQKAAAITKLSAEDYRERSSVRPSGRSRWVSPPEKPTFMSMSSQGRLFASSLRMAEPYQAQRTCERNELRDTAAEGSGRKRVRRRAIAIGANVSR